MLQTTNNKYLCIYVNYVIIYNVLVSQTSHAGSDESTTFEVSSSATM